MDDLEARINARLVELIGIGNVAVIDGPLADPMVIEARPLFEDTSLAWALQRYHARARDLTLGNLEANSDRARRPVAIVYVAPDERVHVIVEPTPACDVQTPSHTQRRMPLLEPHHIQHRHQRIGSFAVLDFPSSRRTVTLFMRGSDRLGSRFANKTYRYTFDGVGYARGGQYLLVNGERVPVGNYDEQRAAVMNVQREVPVVLRYAYDQGLTLGGNTKFYKDRIAATSGRAQVLGNDDRLTMMAFRFKWSPKQRFWYVPRSRYTAWTRAAVDEVAEALRSREIPVEVVYKSPRDAGVETLPEPKPRPPVPAPHGWPPIPLDDAFAKKIPEEQLRAIPRYSAENYRWHNIQLGRLATRIDGLATNILGHRIIAHPPGPLVPFWVLVVDGERWGRGEDDFFVLANTFHAELVPRIEPIPEPRRVEVTDDDIAGARARVAQRKARSRALDDVARAAGIEVCPRAVFEIEPAPEGREQIKARAEAFADLVHRFRELHEIELWAAGKLVHFPRTEALRLNNNLSLPSFLGDRNLAHAAVEWARERYASWLETVIDVMKPNDRQDATRVLDFCVRDIASGRRRAREGRPYVRPAEPLDLLAYRAPEPAPEEPSRVIPPAPASKPREAAAKPATGRGQAKAIERAAAAWTEHLKARPERPWTNVPNTSCFVRNEQGVDVTLCPTPQTKPVENCPPRVTSINDKSRRVMLCDADTVLYFGSLADAQAEAANMAVRKRVSRAAEPSDEWPAAEDFAAQERFLDALVPARLVFDRDRPFSLMPVEVAPPRIVAGAESIAIDKWRDQPIPDDAELEPQVAVGKTRVTGLREFVDALGDELFVYRGQAVQKTIDGLLSRLSRPEHVALNRKKTANDIQHGVFAGRSLYWIGDGTHEFIGPVLANGRLASGRAKDEVLERLATALPLPDTLPFGWTLEDSIVIAALVRGEPAWSVWNASSATFSAKRESAEAWDQPNPVSNDPDPKTGVPGYVAAAFETIDRLLDHAPATIRFRVAGRWLGLVFPSDYGNRVVFDPPTGGELDLELLERIRDRHQHLSVEFPHEEDHVDDFKRAKRRVEWARKWLREHAEEAKPKTSAKATKAKSPPRARKPATEPTRTAAQESKRKPTDAELEALAREHGLAPGERSSLGNRWELLYAAEKRGWGPKMRSWLVKHRLIKSESATEYGARARGRLAFERGEAWPPPPARGGSYSPKEYEGVVDSIADSPEAQAAKSLADHWSATIKKIPGAARFYRNHDLAQATRDRWSVGRFAQLDDDKTPESAKRRYEQVKAVLEVLTRDMRTSLDPSLYDKSREPGDVYPTLCEISNDIAKEVLETLYGIEFPEQRDHYALCDGKASLGELDQKAKQHAEADAARQRKSNEARLADGRALLAVAKDAASRGELTETRFNLAYWRLHPELPSYRRDEHRLRLTWFPSFRQTRGVAPKGSGNATDGFVRGPSGHGFSAKVYDADGEVAVVEAVVAAIRKDVARLEAELSAETSAPKPAATKPKRPRKRSSAKAEAGPTEAALAELARASGVTPERGGTIGDRMHVLYEAEKRGWGPQMRRWMLDHRRLTPQTATSYGADARGRLALERGDWPPPPARGKSYSKAEYAGLLRSLERSPEALAAAELAKQWTEAIARIPDARWYFHGHDLAERAKVQTILNNTAQLDGVRTPESAAGRYATLKERLADLSERMRLSMDPTLYDGSRTARDVYQALCKVDADVAKHVLAKVYGLEFGDGAEHFRLCEGELDFDEFERLSDARAREKATRELEAKRDEIADARALLAVAEQTRASGELTEHRFNTTYWRLHPALPKGRRERLRLSLKWSPGLERGKPGIAPPQTDKRTTAEVFGPNGYGFRVSVQGKAQAEVIEALLDEIRRGLAEAERELGSIEGHLAASAPAKPESSMTENEQPQDEAYAHELEVVEAANTQRRIADAQALLSVVATTRERGELTAANFNRIYWQTQRIPKYRRKDLQLRIVAPKKGSKAMALVVGPNNQGFHVELPGEATEAVAIAALVEQIEREFAALGGAPTPARAPKRTRGKAKAHTHTPAAEPPRSKPATVDAKKLRALADTMETKANAELSVDRLENTPRRATMAAGIRDRARRQLVLAQTLRRIADAGEAGGYQYISRVANKADLEALETELSRAGSERRRIERVFEYWKPAEPELRDIDHAVYRGFRADRSGVRELLDFTRELPGLDRPRKVLEATAARLGEDYESLQPAEIEAVRAMQAGIRKAKIPAKEVVRQVEALGESLREFDRFTKLGVVDTDSLRAALREYLTCCRGHERKQKDDPIAVKKRELAFAKIPGFFPTPRPLVERMVHEADLEPGMRVLEPSAGDGAIALVIRERHPDVELDVIERQVLLRELLTMQGFSLVDDDFCAYTPAVHYDRILMNPPFEAKQDVQHIAHALDLLAPGGRLVAIASAGLSFRDDPKTKALRDRIEQLGGCIEPLPSGSFEASGTGVNTVLVVADKPSVAARREPAQASAPRPEPRSEPMSKCSVESTSPCRPKPKRSSKQTKAKAADADVKAQLAAEVANQEQAKASKPKASKPKASKPKASKPKSSAKTKPTSDAKTSKKTTSKKKTSKKKATKKKATKKKKLPNWHYTVYRNERYRYREVDNTFVVERQRDKQWVAPSASAAKAIHDKSESICALAAKILPNCGGDKPKPTRIRPTNAQKQSMRKFLGL